MKPAEKFDADEITFPELLLLPLPLHMNVVI
jgi:hypothetical protein